MSADREMGKENVESGMPIPTFTATDHEPTSRKQALLLKTKKIISLINIEPALLVHMTASFLGNLMITDLIYYQACTVSAGKNESYCTSKKTQDHDAQEIYADINVWRQVIDNSFPVLFVLFLGAWSDIYGRKLPILLAMVGYVIRYIGLLICVYFPSTTPEVVAVVSSLPVSLTGGRTAISMALYSYVADTTSIADRTLKTGIITAIRTFGKSAGSALGGVLKKRGYGYVFIFAVGGGLDLVAFTYTIFMIRNTRKENVNRSGSTLTIMKQIFNLNNILDSAKAFFKKREGRARLQLILLVITLICTMAPMQGEESTLQAYFYAVTGWQTGDYAYYGTFRMLIAFFGGLVSLGLLVETLKCRDSVLGILSCISQIAGSLVYAFADSPWMLYLAPVVDILNGSMIIASRSMISKIVPRDEIGKVNAFVGTLDSLTPLPANPIYAFIYKKTLDTFIGTFFLVSVALTIPPLIIFFIFSRHFNPDKTLEAQLKARKKDSESVQSSFDSTDNSTAELKN